MSKPDTGVVNIHGKQYQTVALRVGIFRERYPEHSLITEVMQRDDKCVVMQARIVTPDGRVLSTGHAEEYRAASSINKTSALENAETSAIGRALAGLGFGGTEFASADEVARAVSGQKSQVIAPAKEAAKGIEYDAEKIAKVVSALIDFHAMADSGTDTGYKAFELWESIDNEEKLVVNRELAEYPKVRAWLKAIVTEHRKMAA